MFATALSAVMGRACSAAANPQLFVVDSGERFANVGRERVREAHGRASEEQSSLIVLAASLCRACERDRTGGCGLAIVRAGCVIRDAREPAELIRAAMREPKLERTRVNDLAFVECVIVDRFL